MAPLETAHETSQENGMVFYVRMCGSRDMEVWKSEKTADSAYLAVFPVFQTFISREPHIQTLQTIPFSWLVLCALSSGAIHFSIWAILKIGIYSIKGFDHKIVKMVPFCHLENIFSLVAPFFWIPHLISYKNNVSSKT